MAWEGERATAYNVWNNIRRKCEDPKHENFAFYGARGIKICERWQSFDLFFKDMGDRPRGMTIERVDNNGNYSPENCQWATRTEQARNRRNNRLLTLEGRTQCVAAWAEETGLKTTTIRERIDRCGWSVERALPTRTTNG